MTPRLSVIGAAIRKIGEFIGKFGDSYWNNVVLAMKMDKKDDPNWNKVVLGCHFDQPDPHWSNTVLALNMDGGSGDPYWSSVILAMKMNGANGATTFTDMAGQTITSYGNAQISTAQSKFGGSSLSLDASGDYLLTGASSNNVLSGDFTIEFWVRLNAYPSIECYVIGWSGGQYVHIDSLGRMTVISAGSAGTVVSIPLNTWTHVAVVKLSGTTTVYFDGVSRGSATNVGVFGSGSPQIGIGTWGGAGGAMLNGYIDDLRVTKGVARYTGNFTPPTASFDGNPLAPTDLKGKTVTAYGNATLSSAQSKFGGSSCYFDGSGDYLDVTSSADFSFGTGDFTVEFWVWTSPTTAAWSRIVENEEYNVTGGWHFSYNGLDSAGSRRLGFQLGRNGGGGDRLESVAAIPTSQWVHITVTRASGVLSYFVDGKLQAAVANTENFTSQKLRLGATLGTASNFLTGYVDDLRITKGVARYGAGLVAGDGNWNNVILAMRMDGTNGSTTFTDLKGHTVTPSGSAQISTAQSKFGGASAVLSSGNLITTSSDYDFGTADFTVEFWVYATANYGGLVRFRSGTGWSDCPFQIYYAAGNIGAGSSGSTFSSPASSVPLNTWKFITACRSGGNLYLGVDGVVAGPYSVGISGAINVTTHGIQVGGINTAGQVFSGYIDDLRITKGLARYTSNFTAPTSAFPDGGTPSGTYVFTPKTHAFRNPDTALIWDEKGKTATLVGSPSLNTTTKKFGDASLSLNGTTDYVTYASSTDFGFGAGDFTIEFWVNTTATSGALLDWRHYSDFPFTYIGLASGYAGIWNGTELVTGTTLVNTGSWVHLVYQRKQGVLQLYVNGVLDARIESSMNLGATRALYIGATFAGAGFLAGYIDDLRITKGVGRYLSNFTPAAYPFLEPNNKPLFLEETGKTVTVNGDATVSTSVVKYGGGAAYFDGSGDYVSVPDSTDLDLGSDDWTVECWAYLSSTPTINAILVDKRNADGTADASYVFYVTPTLEVRLDYSTDGTTYINSYSGATVSVGTWNHYAWVRSQNTLFTYLNGVVVGAHTISGALFNSTSPLKVGNRADGARSWPGYIDDLRITKGVARYICNWNPGDPLWNNVVLAMKMDGSNGSTTFTDLKGNTFTATGSPTISTAQSKFGGASGRFTTSNFITSSSNISLPGDFTIEFWVYFNTLSGRWGLVQFGSTDMIEVNRSSDAKIYGVISSSVASSSTVTTGVWYHVALVRIGSTGYLYLNGVLQNSGAVTGASLSGPVKIGTANGLGTDVFIDDLRITTVARYTSNFTPPTSATPDSGGSTPVSIFTPPTRALQSYYAEPVDPHWDKVVLGLHMDGADNGTVFTDVRGKTVSVFGNACTKTATKKFGTASAYFDGTGDYLSIPDSTDFAFGSGGFTIEGWLYTGATTTANIISKRLTVDFAPFSLVLVAGNFYARFSANGTSWAVNIASDSVVSTSSWVHFAVTRSGDTVRLFVNGVLQTATGTVSGALMSNTSGVYIGANSDGSAPYTGYIDDLRITKGVARYTANFQPDQFPFPEKAYDPLPVVADPYIGNVVLGMHMDGADNGTVFTDITGKTFSLTGTPTTKTAIKRFGTASAYFNGSTDFISTSAVGQDFVFGSGSYTIEAWIYPTSSNNFQDFIFFGVDYTNAWFFRFYGNTQTVGHSLYSGTTSQDIASSVSGNVKLNTWTHVAVSRDATSARLYVNGALCATATFSLSQAAPSGSPVLRIGRDSTTDWFQGYIDDLRITKGVARYTADFTPPGRFPDVINLDAYDPYWNQVVLAMHMDGADNGTTFTDVKGKTVSVFGNTVTKTGVKRFGTASAYFDGAGDYLTVSDSSDMNFGSGAFTVEFWFNLSALPAASGTMSLVAKGATSTSNLAYRVVVYNSAGTYYIFYQDSASGTALSANFSATPSLTTGVWRHFAISRGDGTVRMFLDGIVVSTSTTITNLFSSASTTMIGAEGAGISPLNGYIDDLRITKGVARYTANFTPPHKAFPEQTLNYYDPYWSNVVLAMHMDGSNNGTVFTDQKGKVVTANGNAVTSTAQKKFGVSSAYFDGSGDYLSTPYSADFAFGTGDFTVEAWVYIAGNSSVNGNGVRGATIVAAGITATGNVNYWCLVLGGDGTTTGTSLLFDTLTGGVAAAAASTVSITQSAWHHVAAVRSNGVVSLYLDGVKLTLGTNTLTTQNLQPTNTQAITIGGQIATNYNNYLNGYIDDLRITKGVARYLTNFTPPTAPFADD